MKILIVEDNLKLQENLRDYFELDAHHVLTTDSGKEAIRLIHEEAFDCVILDLNIKELSGEDVIKEIREMRILTPIIVLSAKTSKDSIVNTIIDGADDYVTKPFSFEELGARITALKRRAKNSNSNETIELKNKIEIFKKTKEVKKDGVIIKLSPKEYFLLEYLAENRGIVKNRIDILENVWGEHDDLLFSQTVDVHVAYIRRKLGKTVIKTGIGGYYID